MTLETITADLLSPLPHGFFTRKGGASSGVFEGLNCGFGSSDQADVVKINRARAAKALAADPGHVTGMTQTHSADAITVAGPQERPWPDADGIVTKTPGVVLSVLTADCAPVLFADQKTGVIGAAHAGWRGALGGVLESTIDAMVALGAIRGEIRAAIGPTISQDAYEVGTEFFDEFTANDPKNTRFFRSGRKGKHQFDLPGFALDRLAKSGISHAEWCRHCTYSDPARFFSYRRSVHNNEADYGRLMSLIRL